MVAQDGRPFHGGARYSPPYSSLSYEPADIAGLSRACLCGLFRFDAQMYFSGSVACTMIIIANGHLCLGATLDVLDIPDRIRHNEHSWYQLPRTTEAQPPQAPRIHPVHTMHFAEPAQRGIADSSVAYDRPLETLFLRVGLVKARNIVWKVIGPIFVWQSLIIGQ